MIIQFLILIFFLFISLSCSKTSDGYYLINYCGGVGTMSGCQEWVHESQLSEEEKWNAMTITERMLHTAKQERKNKQKKSNTTLLKRNIGLKEVSVCKESPIKLSTYKNTASFKWRGLPEWDNCFGVLIEDNFNDLALKRNPNRYEGEWTNGKKTGLAKIYLCNDGSFPHLDVYHRNDYTRKYNIEKRQYTFEESGCYVYAGMVQNGVAHGKGIFYNVNGNIEMGEWKYNELMSGKNYTIKEFNSLSRPGEKEILSLFDEKIIKENNNNTKPQYIKIPQIVITSSIIDQKKGTIQGRIINSENLAEFTIDTNKFNYDTNGNFTYSTFIPKAGIEVRIKAIDLRGKITEKILYLERDQTLQKKVLDFEKLNPLKIKGKQKSNAIALIIGISNYKNIPNAVFADRDADYFADFAENTIGINQNNIKLISNEDASVNQIKKALKLWLKGYSEINKSDIYIFFAGHGLASTDGKELYLMPYDGEPRILSDTALLRSDIFDTIKSIQPKSVTVFFDTCYSGQSRDESPLLPDARPLSIVPIKRIIPQNFNIFSASSGSQVSGSLPEANHGLFSYYIMKGLEGNANENNDKIITSGELYNYVHYNVTRQANRLGKEQTPEFNGDLNKVLVEVK